ncbi:unnamed protein product [Rhizoctonia solani]|uniref:Uncharacterized protein n=1 Tax=Rhizoctonia solani TaxID=456999 RepID=A0A8H3CSG4_9AGAM|nr:unnamed protein product [Rhizoctonia solani]
MTSVMQTSYFADFLDTVWPTGPETVHEKSLADTLVIPVEEHKLPPRLSDDHTKADNALLHMLINNVPQAIIRSILRFDSYDILIPRDPSTAPYIAISYADDTQEEYLEYISDPIQESAFLMVPPPGITAMDRDEDSDDELDIPPYTPIDLEDSENLESSSDLRKFFAGCDLNHTSSISPSLNLTSVGIVTNPGSSHTTESQSTKPEPASENWNGIFARSTEEELETGEETDSSLELYGSDTESDITQFSYGQ